MGIIAQPDMPPEFGAILMKKILACNELIKSVNEEDKKILLDKLAECAMTDIQMIRLIPDLDQVGLMPLVSKDDDMEFKNKLQKVCGAWPKRK